MNVITNRNPIKTAYTKVLDSSTYEQPLYLILSFYTLINARLCTHVKTTYYNRKSHPFRWLFHMQLLFLLPIAEMIFRFHNPYFRSNWNAIKQIFHIVFFILIHPCEIYFPIELGWFVPCIPYLLPSVPLALNPIHLDPSGFLAIHRNILRNVIRILCFHYNIKSSFWS